MNKGDIVEKLRERGLSRRRAVLILDFVLDEVCAALKRGESVEFANGSLKRVRHAHRQQQGRFLNRNATIYRKPYTVAFEKRSAARKPPQSTAKLQDRLTEPWRRHPVLISNCKRGQS